MEDEEIPNEIDELEDLRLEIEELDPPDQVNVCLDRLKEAYDRIGSLVESITQYKLVLEEEKGNIQKELEATKQEKDKLFTALKETINDYEGKIDHLEQERSKSSKENLTNLQTLFNELTFIEQRNEDLRTQVDGLRAENQELKKNTNKKLEHSPSFYLEKIPDVNWKDEYDKLFKEFEKQRHIIAEVDRLASQMKSVTGGSTQAAEADQIQLSDQQTQRISELEKQLEKEQKSGKEDRKMVEILNQKMKDYLQLQANLNQQLEKEREIVRNQQMAMEELQKDSRYGRKKSTLEPPPQAQPPSPHHFGRDRAMSTNDMMRTIPALNSIRESSTSSRDLKNVTIRGVRSTLRKYNIDLIEDPVSTTSNSTTANPQQPTTTGALTVQDLKTQSPAKAAPPHNPVPDSNGSLKSSSMLVVSGRSPHKRPALPSPSDWLKTSTKDVEQSKESPRKGISRQSSKILEDRGGAVKTTSQPKMEVDVAPIQNPKRKAEETPQTSANQETVAPYPFLEFNGWKEFFSRSWW